MFLKQLTRSSKKDQTPVVHAQKDTIVNQPHDLKENYIQTRPNLEWFTKKSGSVNAKRRTTWFDLLLKLDIDQNEHQILGPSTVAIAKKLKELIQKDELTIADYKAMVVLTEAHLTKHFAARYHIQGIEDMIHDRWSKEVHYYHIEALNGIHHWEDARQDFFKAKINNISPHKVYSGTDDKIPCTMSGTEKGVVYLNQYNRLSLMKLNEVHKFYDGTLMKIRDNLLEIVTKNKLGRGNKRLKGRDWNDKDIKRSNEMLDKIDQIMKHKEQLRRLDEYVGC
ncbi:hypothetical protein Tco_0695730 [Tanacetum coccineum]